MISHKIGDDDDGGHKDHGDFAHGHATGLTHNGIIVVVVGPRWDHSRPAFLPDFGELGLAYLLARRANE